MEEKTNFEYLSEFASATGMELEFSETPYPEPIFRKNLQKFKRIAYLYYRNDLRTFLLFHGDPYKIIGEHRIFFGAFCSSDLPIQTRLNFRKKDILDKINPSTPKSGFKKFDSKFVATEKKFEIPKIISDDINIQKQIYESLGLTNNLHFSINNVNVNFVPSLRETSVVGIYQPQHWIIEKELLKKMLYNIRHISNQIDRKIYER